MFSRTVQQPCAAQWEIRKDVFNIFLPGVLNKNAIQVLNPRFIISGSEDVMDACKKGGVSRNHVREQKPEGTEKSSLGLLRGQVFSLQFLHLLLNLFKDCSNLERGRKYCFLTLLACYVCYLFQICILRYELPAA